MRIALAIAAIALAAGIPRPSAAQSEEQRVLAAEDEYVAAEVSRDEATLRRLVDDRFVLNYSNGSTLGKEELIQSVLEMTMVGQTVRERTVVIEGDVAIIFGINDVRFVAAGGSEAESSRRYMSTYIKRDGQWRMLALQLGEDDAANSRVVWIGLANGTEPEAVAAAELRALLRKYDLEPWILIRRVLIDENQIPNSGPPPTLNAAENGDELGLLSDFVHEQLHWLEDEPWLGAFEAALADFEVLFPDVPSFADGGATSDQATYVHLLVCDLEYQALTALVGEVAARETLAGIRYYQWIYEKVLNDSRIREVALRHGFDVSKGVPRAQ